MVPLLQWFSMIMVCYCVSVVFQSLSDLCYHWGRGKMEPYVCERPRRANCSAGLRPWGWGPLGRDGGVLGVAARGAADTLRTLWGTRVLVSRVSRTTPGYSTLTLTNEKAPYKSSTHGSFRFVGVAALVCCCCCC